MKRGEREGGGGKVQGRERGCSEGGTGREREQDKETKSERERK